MRHYKRALLGVTGALVLVAGVSAAAHIERPSYWPLPEADCSIRPCAGGEIPAARSLPPEFLHFENRVGLGESRKVAS